MRLAASIILAFFLLSSCQKGDRIERRLSGEWDVVKLRMVTSSKGVCDSVAGDYSWDETYGSPLYSMGGIRYMNERKEGEMTGIFFIMRPSTARTSEHFFEWAYEFTYSLHVNEQDIIVMEGRYSDTRSIQFQIVESSYRKLKLRYYEETNCASAVITMWCEKD